MKKKSLFSCVLAYLMALGLILMSCEDTINIEGSGSGLNGTWVNSKNSMEKWTLNNGNHEVTADTFLGSLTIKGTYTDNSRTVTWTHRYIYGSFLMWYGLSSTSWYTIEEFALVFKQETGEDFGPTVETFSYRIEDNTLYVTFQDGKEGVLIRQSQRNAAVDSIPDHAPYSYVLEKILPK